MLVEAVPEKVYATVGPIYQHIAERWAAFLDTLNDDQIAFASTLLNAATAVNREEIERLRGTADGNGSPPEG